MEQTDKYRSLTPELAIKLMKAFSDASQALDYLGELSIKIEDSEERLRVRTAIGESIGLLLTEVERPIVRSYPELEPSSKT